MARDFPGSTNTDRIVVTNYSAINSLTTFTVSFLMWIDATDTTFRRIYDKRDTAAVGSGGTHLSVENGGFDFQSFLWNGSLGEWRWPVPSTGAWHHVCISYAHSSTTEDPIMHVDGVAQTLSFEIEPTGSVGSESVDLMIGNRGDTLRCFNGNIQEFAFWNRILAADEKAALAKNYAPACFPRGRVAYLPLIGRYSPELNLATGGGNTGTVTGTTTVAHHRMFYPSRATSGWRAGQTYPVTVSGALATVGALNRQTGIAKAGTVTTVGTLVKRTSKLLARTVAAAGALTAIKTALKEVSGTLTAAGALLKQARSSLAGTLTTAGALLKHTSRSVAGTLSTAGALSAIKTALKSVTGMLATAGGLLKQARANPAGTLSTAGTVSKDPRRAVVSTLSPAGTLARQAGKFLAGTVSPAGVVRLLAHKLLTATLGLTGQVVKQLRRDLAGTLTSSGSASGVLTALLFNLIRFLFGRGVVSRYSAVAASVSSFAGPQGQVSRIAHLTATF